MSRSHLADAARAAAIALLFLASCAQCETIALGSVIDSTTGAPVAGASVSIKQQSGGTLAEAISNEDGTFRLAFDVGDGDVQRFAVSVELSGYRTISQGISVTRGKTDRPSYSVKLLPEAIAACVIQSNRHSIVVGYIRPPSSMAGQNDLAERVRDALELDLLPRIQRNELPPERQPKITACVNARPASRDHHSDFAKSLRADAFVSGHVVPASQNQVTVEMAVADRHDRLVPPVLATSAPVDLDNARAARLGPETYAAVLIALAGGYESGEDYAACVELVGLSESILGRLHPKLAEARDRCQTASPLRGLTQP